MRKQQLILLALLAAACAAAYRAGLTGRQAGGDAPPTPVDQVVDGLAIDGASLDFGEVWEDEHFTRRVQIRNQTGHPVVIERFVVSCSLCISVESPSIRLGVGETAEVAINLNLAHRDLRDFGKATRSIVVGFWPMLEGEDWARTGKDKKSWTVRCTVKSRVTVDTQAINFGETPVHGQSSPPIRVLVAAHMPGKDITALADPAKLSVRVQPQRSRPNRFELLVTPKPELPPGHFESEVSLDLVQENGERVHGITLPVTGEVQPEIRALPARLLLGARPEGSVAEEIVVLQAPEGAMVQVERIETDSVDVHIETTSVPGLLAGRAFRVSQKITRVGDQRSTAKFVLKRDGDKPRTVEMEITYRGEPTEAKGPASQGQSGRKAP